MFKKGLESPEFDPESSTQPKYEQLRDYFAKQMITGRLRAGEKIPSEHHLVEVLGLARTTIRQAMAALENEGLIRRVQGKGTFVEEDARRKLQHGQDIFALMVPETRTGFYPSLLHGFEAAAGNVHHQTIVCNSNNDVGQQADIILQLLDKEVGGVAIVPTSQPTTPVYQVRQLQKRGIPVVFCHRRVEGISSPLLKIPFREAGLLAGRELAKHGHRRVALLTTQRTPVTPLWEEGLNEGLKEFGNNGRADLVLAGETIALKEEELYTSLKSMFSWEEPPTAIFATFDSVAEMIYFLLPRFGLRVSEDISLIGFGGAWREGAFTRRLTSIVIDEIETGKQAVQLLHEMRRGDRSIDDNTEIVLKLDISHGETVAMAADKKRVAR
jgi:DNA-binding LacI/PurR family transcriptional regulator